MSAALKLIKNEMDLTPLEIALHINEDGMVSVRELYELPNVAVKPLALAMGI